jgi:hypothetical protein
MGTMHTDVGHRIATIAERLCPLASIREVSTALLSGPPLPTN